MDEIVIIGADGTEHIFPAGTDPKRAAAIVRQKTTAGATGEIRPRTPGLLESAGAAIDEVLPGNQSLASVGQYVGDTISNIPGSANKLVTDTASGVAGLATMLGRVPFEPKEGPEQLASTALNIVPGVIGHIRESYGTPEAIAHSIRTDPVGVVADVAAVAAPFSATKNVARSAAQKTVGRAAGKVGQVARAGAEKLYQTTLKPLSVDELANRSIAKKFNTPVDSIPAQIGIEQGIIPTPTRVAKAQADAVTKVRAASLDAAKQRFTDTYSSLENHFKTIADASGRITNVRIKPDFIKKLAELANAKEFKASVRLPDIPDDLKRLAAALNKDSGRLAPSDFLVGGGLAGAGTVIGGVPGTIIGGLLGIANRSPFMRGATAIGLDRTGRAIEAAGRTLPNAAPSIAPTTLALSQLEEELLRRELEEQLRNSSPLQGGR